MRLIRNSFLAGLVLGVAVLLAAAPARADWLLTPFAGTTFGADATKEQFTYGGSLAYMGANVVGFEMDFGSTPEFFEPENDQIDLIDDSNVTSLMGNLVIGAPIGGSGAQVRPYVVGGVGLLRTSVTSADQFFDISNNDFGFDVGGGIYVFFNEHVGIRGDVRYFRSLQDPEEDDEFDVAAGNFDFWRGTGGITFRF
jgi:opacity protein-like surface antigen